LCGELEVLAAPMHLAPRLAAASMDPRGYQIAARGADNEKYVAGRSLKRG